MFKSQSGLGLGYALGYSKYIDNWLLAHAFYMHRFILGIPVLRFIKKMNLTYQYFVRHSGKYS